VYVPRRALGGLFVQATVTSVMFTAETPLPRMTVHAWPVGCEPRATPKPPGASIVWVNVNAPFVVMGRFTSAVAPVYPIWSERPVPVSPVTVPPTLNGVELVQVMATFEILAEPMVPAPEASVQICAGLVG
jgi:hypothetical protein